MTAKSVLKIDFSNYVSHILLVECQ